MQVTLCSMHKEPGLTAVSPHKTSNCPVVAMKLNIPEVLWHWELLDNLHRCEKLCASSRIDPSAKVAARFELCTAFSTGKQLRSVAFVPCDKY